MYRSTFFKTAVAVIAFAQIAHAMRNLQQATGAAAPAQAPATPTQGPANPGQYRMCIPVEEGNDASFLQKCNAAMALANDAEEGVSFSCIAGGSEEGCMKLVRDGSAELTKFGPSYVYTANRDYGLEPIVSENYGSEAGKEYYSVAVVKKEFCDTPGVSLASLKGKSSCHTGYRKTAGWNMPVGYLVESGVMDVKNSEPGINTDAESVANFFSKVCSPRVIADGPTTAGTAWEPLCTACGGDCTEESVYYDYPGTIRGLNDGVCDVAFTKHTTAAEVVRDGSAPEPWATLSKDDLRLLCPLGGCAPVDDFQNCNFAGVPSQAIVGSVALQRTAEGAKLKDALVNAGKNPAFLAAAVEIDGAEGFILTSDTKSLDAVDGSFLDYFGSGTNAAFKGIETLDETPETSSDGGLSAGAIAGIVIGVAAAGMIVGVLGLVIYKKRGGKYINFDVDIGRPITVNGMDTKL